jgi:hypothetical protein
MFNEMLNVGLPVQLCEYVLRVNSSLPGTREEMFSTDDGEINSVMDIGPLSKGKVLNA